MDEYLVLYSKYENDPYFLLTAIREVMDLVNEAEAVLQATEVGKMPNVEIDIPKDFTHELYIRIFNRITFIVRGRLYKKLKKASPHRPPQKEVIKAALEKVNSRKITDQVCRLYKVKKPEDDEYVLLLERVYYAFLKDKQFAEATDFAKQKNEVLVKSVLAGMEMPTMKQDVSCMSDKAIVVHFLLHA
eukprot:TRINITY_DN9443_c0_g2_i3.p1 TRINITY_DN9443_c0_g2~~TRINITY_DN9443_c0_g2_i3.p1  ORF type:complete len:188 (-),score=53.87 TRINITY_DN9443_c0_g2_i3:246-809(-)